MVIANAKGDYYLGFLKALSPSLYTFTAAMGIIKFNFLFAAVIGQKTKHVSCAYRLAGANCLKPIKLKITLCKHSQ